MNRLFPKLMKKLGVRSFSLKGRNTTSELTEESFLEGIGYHPPEKIIDITIPVLACGGPHDEVFGHIYMTSVGERCYQSGDKSDPAYQYLKMISDWSQQEGWGEARLKSLEGAIQGHPEKLPSVFSVFRSYEAIPLPGDDRVSIIFQY